MQLAHSFFSPLRGKVAVFLIDSKQANFSFVRSVTLLSAMTSRRLAVLDVDAFYSSNSDEILSALPFDAVMSTRVYVPEPGSSIETEIIKLFRTDSDVFLIESLNTVYHLFSSSGEGARSHKFAFAVRGLSYLAKATGKSGLLVMYRRERLTRTARGKSISDLSDLTFSVEVTGSGLLMKSEHGTAWPEGRFSLKLP